MIKLPILEWLPTYKKEDFKGDLIAGLTVGIMLIPQGMAYAMIAGLDPIYGLYASIIPPIIYGIFGTSRHLAVGPVAMDSLLVATGVGAIAAANTEAYVELAILLALMVGILQLLLGIFKLGFLVNFLSRPVISGFTSAAALVIGLSQLKHLIGVDLPRSAYIHEIIINAINSIDQINWTTFSIGVSGIVLILVVKKYFKKIPGSLLAVVLGILVTWVFNLNQFGVNILSEIPTGLPSFQTPSIELEKMQALFSIALTLALVGFMEAIAIGKAIQNKHRNYKIIPNQELIAIGLSNITSSFFQSHPTTGSFSRSAVNDESGGKTGISSIISAILIILILLYLTSLFYFLPHAILASIIMSAVFGLIDIERMKYLWKTDKRDFYMLLATFAGTLMLGIQQGILVGIVLSLVMMIYETTQPHIAILGKIPNEPHYKNLNRFDHLEERVDILIMRFDARLYFANVNYFQEQIEAAIEKKGENLKAFILNAESINSLDSSGIFTIEEMTKFCKERGLKFYLVAAKGPVRDILNKAHLFETIGKEHFFMRTQHAVDYFDDKRKQQFRDIVMQFSDN
jgi:SulP family sulfate permease